MKQNLIDGRDINYPKNSNLGAPKYSLFDKVICFIGKDKGLRHEREMIIYGISITIHSDVIIYTYRVTDSLDKNTFMSASIYEEDIIRKVNK